MADSILYNILGDIITKFGSSAVREIGLLWDVNGELDKLEDTLSAIKVVLLDVEERPFKSNAMADWISKLKYVFYEIDDLLDEFSYETMRSQVMTRDGRSIEEVRNFFFELKFDLKIDLKIKEIRKRLKAINDDKTQFSFSEHVIDTRHDELREKRETYSFILEEEVIGRNDDKEAIIKLLLNTNTKEDIEVISIVGMGGLGKTALAQSIYNDNRMTEHYELKLWVCVSEEFNVRIIIKKITESITGKKPKSSLQIDSLQSELRRKIDGKKYFLVMDDVWNDNHEKWVRLKRLLMGGTKGSRILITTRGEQVAKTFDTTFLYSLKELDEWNSLLLFKKMTGLDGQEEELENSNLVEIGKKIIAKLKGVPLTIRTIGRLLEKKKSKKNWLSFKDKELYQIKGQEPLEEMQLILKLSYKHLSANLKQCFLYCALFPKDYKIQKDELILQWRAQGFIQPNDKDELIDIGEDYFLELLSKSFFQEITEDRLGNITCKMHSLMHDLACSITKNECVHGLRNDINKRTHHVSLDSLSWNECKELPKTLSKAKNLRTFFMIFSAYDHWELNYDEFFHDHLRLRTLQLMSLGTDWEAKFFVSIISKFKHLRYLSISHLGFKDLPSCITELYNLETLILQYSTKLEKLPSDIKNLINLKHLDLYRNMNLEFLSDSITELCKLEALILYGCAKLKGLPRDVKNWTNLRHLDLSENHNIEFLPDSIAQLMNLEALLLYRCLNLKELPKDTKKLINLKHLDMSFCEALTHMPKGLGKLTNLQTLNEFVLGENNGGELSELTGLNKLRRYLRIRNLQLCTTVDLQMKAKFLQLKSDLQELSLLWNNSCNEPTIDNMDDVYERVLDCLQPHSNLQEISIYGYEGVKLCNWLSPDFLSCSVTVSLYGCKRLQHLPQLDQFPYLKHLHLENLPCIKYIGDNDSLSSSTFFPSLENLSIVDMPNLRRWWKGTTSTASTEPTESSFSIKFPCLSKLEVYDCPLHILMSLHAPAMKSLEIGDSEDGQGIEEDEFDGVPWEKFQNLSSLRLFELSKLEYLPKCLQHLTTLQSLTLWDCENLKSLPEWMDNLTSLTKLEIDNCKKLTLLPEGLQHIYGLQSLKIMECPILEERCKKDTGEDWPKIAHIPEVWLSYRRQENSNQDGDSLVPQPLIPSQPEGMCYCLDLEAIQANN